MKGFAILLLSAIFVVLITSSVLSIAKDNSVDGKVIPEVYGYTDIVPDDSPKYKIYLHVIARNMQGELISITETLPCQFGSNCFEYMPKCYLCREPHEITDYAFDTLLGEKEITTIGNMKYEKVNLSNSNEIKERTEQTAKWVVQFCGEPVKKSLSECSNIFHSKTTVVDLEVGDVVTANWTILREMN